MLNMKTIRFSFRSMLGAVALILGIYNCSKPSDFGSELLDDQQVELNADTLPVICTVERDEDLITFDSLSRAPYFLVGQLNSPEFGPSTASVFTQFLPSGIVFRFGPDTTRYDSIMLVMEYIPGPDYGDTTQLQTLTVHELTESITAQRYRASSSVATGNEIGRLDFVPRPRTRKVLFDTAAAAVRYAHVKVRLSDAFGQALFNADGSLITKAEQNPNLFLDAFKGIKIACTTNGLPGAIMGFNMNTAARTYIRLFYTEKDTIKRFFDYNFNSEYTERFPLKFAQYQHEHVGSPAFQAIGQPNPERLYLQGMGGYRLKVEFPTAAAYDKIVVNKAELVLTRVAPVSPAPTLGPLQIVSRIKDDDGNLAFTPDILFALTREGGGRFDITGGVNILESTPLGKVERYRVIVSSHFQSIVDDQSNEPNKRIIYFSINPDNIVNNGTPNDFIVEVPGTNARQGVFYGANDATFPAHLLLKFTQL
jgi:Domain of unknown function (DUF4270)